MEMLKSVPANSALSHSGMVKMPICSRADRRVTR
jgi:hypothetical protein